MQPQKSVRKSEETRQVAEVCKSTTRTSSQLWTEMAPQHQLSQIRHSQLRWRWRRNNVGCLGASEHCWRQPVQCRWFSRTAAQKAKRTKHVQ